MQEFTGPELSIIIRDNVIAGNGEDGIQFIEYTPGSARVFRIERNLIMNNRDAGIGMMCSQDTIEDFQGANILERVYLINNTFVGNGYGVTGGDNLIALNNLFVNTTHIALKRVDGGSIAAYNLFFGNGTDVSGANVDPDTTIHGDLLLNPDQEISVASPAVDAGTAFFEWEGEVVLGLSPSALIGAAPDLGYVEICGGE